MFPEIVRLGPFAIYTYGFMMMLAFAVGILIAVYRGKKVGIEGGIIWDLSLWILFSSLAGARGLYVLTHLQEFKGNWFAVVNPVQPGGGFGIAGMVLLGGVVTALFVSIIFIQKHKLNFWKMADVIAPSLALGIAFGRIGCFANGCCYGYPTHSFPGVIFPPGSPAGSEYPGVPVLPTQLFSSAYALLLFIGLLILERWKSFQGYTFALFLMGYSAFRILIDTIRVYEPGEILIHTETVRVTISQGISGLLLVAGLFLFFILKGRKENAG